MAMKFGNGIDLDGQRIINVGDPSGGTDVANKQYVDAFVRGLSWKNSVVAASTANMAVASAVVNGASMDGVSLVTGDRVLLKNQTAASENGIYVVAASGAASRASDADTAVKLLGATVTVTKGTANGDKVFRLVTDDITLGTTALSFTELGGSGTTYSADGSGIELAGTTFSLELDGATLSKSASGLKLNSSAVGGGLSIATDVVSVNTGTASATGLELSGGTVRIAAAAAGNGLSGGGGSALAVNTGTASATGLEVSSDTVRIATAAAGNGLQGGGGAALSVKADGASSGLSIASTGVKVDSTVARVYATNVGDGTSTNIVVTHGIGTRDVQVVVRNAASPYEQVLVDNEATSTTTCTLRFATAPTTNQYRVIVTGIGA